MNKIIFLLLGIIILSSGCIYSNNTTDVSNLQPTVNNTNLYPSQRTVNTVYWANDSQIDIYLIFHAIGTGAAQEFDSNLSVNGVVLQDHDFKTSAGTGFHDHWPLSATIPKGANYSVTNSTNVNTIEWREYPYR